MGLFLSASLLLFLAATSLSGFCLTELPSHPVVGDGAVCPCPAGLRTAPLQHCSAIQSSQQLAALCWCGPGLGLPLSLPEISSYLLQLRWLLEGMGQHLSPEPGCCCRCSRLSVSMPAALGAAFNAWQHVLGHRSLQSGGTKTGSKEHRASNTDKLPQVLRCLILFSFLQNVSNIQTEAARSA